MMHHNSERYPEFDVKQHDSNTTAVRADSVRIVAETGPKRRSSAHMPVTNAVAEPRQVRTNAMSATTTGWAYCLELPVYQISRPWSSVTVVNTGRWPAHRPCASTGGLFSAEANPCRFMAWCILLIP